MATRRRKGGGTPWWMIATAVLAALLIVWWFRAQRVESPAPPAIRSEDPSLARPPEGHVHEEIAPDEKADLQRIIRERGAPSPGR